MSSWRENLAKIDSKKSFAEFAKAQETGGSVSIANIANEIPASETTFPGIYADATGCKNLSDKDVPEDIVDSTRVSAHPVALRRLTQLAEEYCWDLDDLLDWFRDDLDMSDLARWTMPQVRQSVEFYINHHNYLKDRTCSSRSEG